MGFAEETFPHSSSWIPDAGLTLRSTAAGNNQQSIGETTDVNTCAFEIRLFKFTVRGTYSTLVYYVTGHSAVAWGALLVTQSRK